MTTGLAGTAGAGCLSPCSDVVSVVWSLLPRSSWKRTRRIGCRCLWCGHRIVVLAQWPQWLVEINRHEICKETSGILYPCWGILVPEWERTSIRSILKLPEMLEMFDIWRTHTLVSHSGSAMSQSRTATIWHPSLDRRFVARVFFYWMMPPWWPHQPRSSRERMVDLQVRPTRETSKKMQRCKMHALMGTKPLQLDSANWNHERWP